MDKTVIGADAQRFGQTGGHNILPYDQVEYACTNSVKKKQLKVASVNGERC